MAERFQEEISFIEAEVLTDIANSKLAPITAGLSDTNIEVRIKNLFLSKLKHKLNHARQQYSGEYENLILKMERDANEIKKLGEHHTYSAALSSLVDYEKSSEDEDRITELTRDVHNLYQKIDLFEQKLSKIESSYVQQVNNLKSDLQATPAAAEYALEIFNEFLNEEERRLENL